MNRRKALVNPISHLSVHEMFTPPSFKLYKPPARFDFHFTDFGGLGGTTITLREVTVDEQRRRLIKRLVTVLSRR